MKARAFWVPDPRRSRGPWFRCLPERASATSTSQTSALAWAIACCLAASSCAALGGSPEATQAARFDDLLRFVPAGSESLLCFDLRPEGVPPALIEAFRDGFLLKYFTESYHEYGHLERGVWSAGRFRPRPKSAGDYEGVFVLEYSASVAPERQRLAAGPDVRRERIADREVFREADDLALPFGGPGVRAARTGPLEVWRAFLDDHTILTATRRSLLEAALRGDGPGGAERARSFGFPGTTWAAPLTLLRRYDPSNAEDQCSPLHAGRITIGKGPRKFRFPITAWCAEIVRGPTLSLLGHTLGADPEVAREEFAGLFQRALTETRALADGGFELDLERDGQAPAFFELGMWAGFGFNVMM